MPNVEEMASRDGAGPTCRWHDSLRMDVHDLKADNGRQWDAILKLSTTCESVQHSAVETSHSMDLLAKSLEHHYLIGHNGREKKDEKKPADTVDRLVNIFWKVVELAAVGALLWVLAHSLGGVAP